VLKGLGFTYLKKQEKNKVVEEAKDFAFESGCSPSDLYVKAIDLSSQDEYIARIQGTESNYCITKLALTTNLGHKFEVGNDFIGLASETDMFSTPAGPSQQ